MSAPSKWLTEFSVATDLAVVDGIVPVEGYDKFTLSVEEVAIMEKAYHYEADAVFFEASRDGKPPVAQAFLYRSDGRAKDTDFADLHRRLWSWGGVPLIYRVFPGLVQLFRCAHRPDFSNGSNIIIRPFDTLNIVSDIASDPWWDAEQLRAGTLWDDPVVCNNLVSSAYAAQKTLITSVKTLYQRLNERSALPSQLQRRLLILSILIAYLESRGVFEEGFFGNFLPDAKAFFEVLANGPALVKLLDHLEKRFNGQVFVIDANDRNTLIGSQELDYYAQLVEGHQESTGQRTLWQLYSFADLPVELISHIYQLFVKDNTAVYTPHFVVRLMLGEILSWERLDQLHSKNEVILDPACGSGIFLVEAYKRLILHWRYRNGWNRPDKEILKELLTERLRGIDLDETAVELAAFSLCLALCDALEPKEIRISLSLFPPLKEKTIHTGCFFEAIEKQKVKEAVGVIVGNPPFSSKLNTPGAQRAYEQYQKEYAPLPDKQVAYLFLEKSMQLLASGGVLSMLQQYNFLYNKLSQGFRRSFIERWDVREILDFVSVRGLFMGGRADTKVVVVVSEARTPPPNRQILHATFRRSGRIKAEQGFDIDYYDMHWVQRNLAVSNDAVWRCNLLGGGRVLGFMDRVKSYRTLERLASESKWEIGEGWIVGRSSDSRSADHIVGKPFVEPQALLDSEISSSSFDVVPDTLFQWPRRSEIFEPPLLLIHKHEDLNFGTWEKAFLTYRHTILGISGVSGDQKNLRRVAEWFKSHKRVLQAIITLSSSSSLTSKATAVLSGDILQLPCPTDWNLDLAPHELILIEDIVDYYRDLIRLGGESAAMSKSGENALASFSEVFTARINGIYQQNQLHALDFHRWPGVICQPYVFGNRSLDWTSVDDLKGKLDALLRDRHGGNLNVDRIAKIYDGPCNYLIKPDRLRYWLRSVALRDADETLADLAHQGF